MGWNKTLFDDDTFDGPPQEAPPEYVETDKEVLPLDRLKSLEEKITAAVEKVKALKEENVAFERRIGELELLLNEKNREIDALKAEKSSIGGQLEELLGELETLDI